MNWKIERLKWITITMVLITMAIFYEISPKTSLQVRIGTKSLEVPVAYGIEQSTIMAVIIGIELLPSSLISYRRWKTNNNIIRDLPTTIRIIRDGLRAGLPLTKIAELLRYGASLSRLVADAINKESLGLTTIKDELNNIATELNNSYLSSLATVLDTVLRSGARAVETMDIMYKLYDEAITYQVNKQNQLRAYVALIYALLIVYVVLAGMVAYLLMPSITTLSTGMQSNISPSLTVGFINIGFFFTAITLSIVIQSIISGLIIGRIVYERSEVGLFHSSILIMALSTLNYILYQLMYVHHVL